MKPLLDLVHSQKSGESVGIYSVSSGGYTGMGPTAFLESVYGLAAEVGLPAERILLGGDHLGSNCWRSLPSESANDRLVLANELIAQRTAALCDVAEQAWRVRGGPRIRRACVPAASLANAHIH